MTTPEEISTVTLAPLIEHTNLKPDASKNDIIRLCEEAMEHQFYGVCISPYFVQLAKKTVKKSGVRIITVVGFPFGNGTTSAKVEETKKAISSGADEIDMVININALKSGDMATVQNDMQAVVTACHLQNKQCKVILETAYLTNLELEAVCVMCKDAGADFVKTSTGFAPSGASVEHVKLMRRLLPAKIKIKAAGGINLYSFAQELIDAGAARIGTSNGLALIQTHD